MELDMNTGEERVLDWGLGCRVEGKRGDIRACMHACIAHEQGALTKSVQNRGFLIWGLGCRVGGSGFRAVGGAGHEHRWGGGLVWGLRSSLGSGYRVEG